CKCRARAMNRGPGEDHKRVCAGIGLAIDNRSHWLRAIFNRKARPMLPRKTPGTLTIAVAGAVAALAASALTREAWGDFKTRSPIVTEGELEFEHNGSVTFDKSKSGKNNSQSYTNEIEYSFLPNWRLGLEGEWAAAPGENLRFEATTI